MIIDPLGNIPIERGGTGATTIEEVKANLGLADSELSNVTNQTFANKAVSAGVANDSGKSLYSNSSGTSGTVALSESAANYSKFEIHYMVGDYGCSAASVWSPNGKKAMMVGVHRYDNDQWVKGTTVKINGTSITVTSYTTAWYADGGNTVVSHLNNIKITKVLAYK